MSIKLSDSIRVGQQKPLEDKYFNELVPYTSTSQVNTLLPKAVRHIGLTVNINGEEYWYKNGIEDKNLTFKSNQKTIEVTRNELDDLIANDELEPNRLYKITGVESWCFSQHLIKAIYLKAITNNTLEIEGVGEFYMPKYNNLDSNLGIWKGELLANGMISSASYNIGDKVIWGNLFWENISGNIGTNEKVYYDEENDEYLYPKLQNYLSETDWKLITPNDDESLYNIQFCLIKYDLINDYIYYREDDLDNKYELSYSNLLINFTNLNLIDIDSQFIYYVNSISLFLWGIDIVSYNNIYESVVLNCNNNHVFQNNIIENSCIYVNTLSNVNFINNKLYNSYFQSNNLSNVNFAQNNLNFSAIIRNILSEMDFDRNILNNSSVQSNNFLNVDFSRNKLDNSIINDNELKTFGGIFNNTLDDSQILGNRYYIQISNNKLINNSQINNNNDNNIIVNNKYTIIKDNILNNNCQISSNIFVEEGKEVDSNIKSIYGNKLIDNCSINNNTIKNGSKIMGHNLSFFSTINGNTLDTESNIYNNQLIQNGKIDNNILTGHGRIYGNQLDRLSEITLCKLRISPTTSYATTIKNNRLFTGKIQNIDFGDIVNPVGTNPNDPAFGGNELGGCFIENGSIIKDLTFPNSGGKFIQFVKMNGLSEFKNITVNDSIRNVDFINTIFNETSDYSKLIEGNGYQTTGFSKTYIDGVLLQDRFDEKQDVLTEDNVGQFMDLELTTKSTPTYGDTVLGRDSLTGKAVEIPTSSLGGGGSVDTSNLVPYTGATQDLNIGAHYFESSAGFKTPNGTPNKALTANGGVFDLTTKADLVGGKIPSSQLPSFVDDVLEFANLASFPTTGESGKIYIALDTNLTYRWGGSSYVVMSSSLALGETSSTAYRGDRGKTAYDHSQATGNAHGTKLEELSDVSGTDTTIIDTDVILKKDTGGFWRKITFANFKNWFTTELAKKINIGVDTFFNFKNISAMTLTEFRSITPNLETIYFTEEQNSTGWQQVRYNSNIFQGCTELVEKAITINAKAFLELDSDSSFNLIDVENTKIHGVFENDFVIITFSGQVWTQNTATANQWVKLILKINDVQAAVAPVFYLTEPAGTPERISYSFALNVTAEMVTHGATLHLKPSAYVTLYRPSITVARVHKSTKANI